MQRSRLLILTALLVAGCSLDPDVPPTGKSMPTDAALQAATPGGDVFTSAESFEHQIDNPVPAFLRGKGDQVGVGISKAITDRPKNPDGGTAVHRWGLWHYFHLGPRVAQKPGGKAKVAIPSREGMTKAAQRGTFEGGKRVGTWTFWYPSGRLRAKGGFTDGKMHGDWKVWTESGELDAEHSGSYANGTKAN